jgi:uncharacterized membrane-anchored protein
MKRLFWYEYAGELLWILVFVIAALLLTESDQRLGAVLLIAIGAVVISIIITRVYRRR